MKRFSMLVMSMIFIFCIMVGSTSESYADMQYTEDTTEVIALAEPVIVKTSIENDISSNYEVQKLEKPNKNYINGRFDRPINPTEYDSSIPVRANVEILEVIEEEENKQPKVNFYEQEYEYGQRFIPAVDIDTSNGIRNYTDEIDTSVEGYTYWGRMVITGYTPKCIHCCGSDSGITASGVEAIPGYTIAAGYEFPFGTTLYIRGFGFYVVEDRGNLGTNVIDIACNDHDECYTVGGEAEVYVVG